MYGLEKCISISFIEGGTFGCCIWTYKEAFMLDVFFKYIYIYCVYQTNHNKLPS